MPKQALGDPSEIRASVRLPQIGNNDELYCLQRTDGGP
jgi:hypothetical protein